MTPTRQLKQLGQSLWLDNITRELLDNGGLRRYIAELSITGLTSNPTIFDQAIEGGNVYDADIVKHSANGKSADVVFMDLALDDLRRAADLFRPVFERTAGVDGWVSMEISPKLADDTHGSIKAAKQIHKLAGKPNLLIKIPGTPAGLPAIEESIFAGIPVNVTLLFSSEQYLAAAHAYMHGIERRIAAGLDPDVASVASLFVSRWDKAAGDYKPADERKQNHIAGDAEPASIALPADLHNRLGIAIGQRTYRAYRELLVSTAWRTLAAAGARPQRLLWASTGTKDPDTSDTLYVEALAAPDTINTMPEKTLQAFHDHGTLRGPMDSDGADCEVTLARFAEAGVDVDALALRLQRDGAQSFVTSWDKLLAGIAERSHALGDAGRAHA